MLSASMLTALTLSACALPLSFPPETTGWPGGGAGGERNLKPSLNVGRREQSSFRTAAAVLTCRAGSPEGGIEPASARLTRLARASAGSSGRSRQPCCRQVAPQPPAGADVPSGG